MSHQSLRSYIADQSYEACRRQRICDESDILLSIAKSVLTALSYPRGSEAQVRCLEEIGQDARYVLSKVDKP